MTDNNRHGRFLAVLKRYDSDLANGWTMQGDPWYEDSTVVVVTADPGVRTYNVELFDHRGSAALAVDKVDTEFHEVDLVVDLTTGAQLEVVSAFSESPGATPIEPVPDPRAQAITAAVDREYKRWTSDGFDYEGNIPGSGADHAESFYRILAAAGLPTTGDPNADT